MQQTSSTELLVPVKSFSEAKARLAACLPERDRAEFARWMAGRVLAAADGMAAHVLCDDREVAEWALAQGAGVLWSPGTGLDGGVRGGVAELGRRGAAHVVVAHGDLPRARLLTSVVVPHAITLVPDQRSDGSNVIALPTDCDFPFAYGRRSFVRHLRSAVATGRSVVVRRDAELAIDVDTPDDLHHPLVQEVLPAWLRTNPASRPMTPR